MKWVLLVALALTVSATGAWADRYSDCNQHDDVDRRIRGCTDIIERGTQESKQNRIAAYYNRGSAYFNKREYDHAIADYTEVIKLDPKFAGAYYYRGSAYLNKREYDRAIADYTEVIKLAPEFVAYAYQYRGNAYFNKREYDRAIADYTEVIKLAPKFADGYALRGWAYEQKGDREKAIADYKKALEIDPSNKIAREGLERSSERIASQSGKRSRKKSTATMAPPRMWPEERLTRLFEREPAIGDLGRAGTAETRAELAIRVADPRSATPAAGAEPKDAQMEGAPARAASTEPSSVGFDGKWQLNDLGGTLDIKGNEWLHPEMGIADLLKGGGPTNYEVQYRHHRGMLCDYRIKKTSDGQRLILEPANPTQPVDFCPSGILLKVGS